MNYHKFAQPSSDSQLRDDGISLEKTVSPNFSVILILALITDTYERSGKVQSSDFNK